MEDLNDEDDERSCDDSSPSTPEAEMLSGSSCNEESYCLETSNEEDDRRSLYQMKRKRPVINAKSLKHPKAFKVCCSAKM